MGYVVLAVAFWYARQIAGGRPWLVDVVLAVYAAFSVIGWVQIGAPNPMGLGYLSKVLEVALIGALGVHMWRERSQPG